MITKTQIVSTIIALALSAGIGTTVYVNKRPYVMPPTPVDNTIGTNVTQNTAGKPSTVVKPAPAPVTSGNGWDEDDDENDDDDNPTPPTTRPTPAPAPAPAPTPAPAPSPAPAPAPSGITLAQISAHNSDASCWSAINGSVYDLTSWIPNHPGGSGTIRRICGRDGSNDYNGQHGGSSRPARILVGFKIGTLAQ